MSAPTFEASLLDSPEDERVPSAGGPLAGLRRNHGSVPSMGGGARSETESISTAELAPPSRRVRVAIRCRPAFEHELKREAASSHSSAGGGASSPIVVKLDKRSSRGGRAVLAPGSRLGEAREFHYDHTFGPSATQSDVYEVVGGPIVAGVLEGYNGTVLAYGQTGTGKTHTMGILDRVTGEKRGLIPRALSHIFGHASKHPEFEWSVTLTFLQIYLENVHDLLATHFIAPEERAALGLPPMAAGSNAVRPGEAGSNAASAQAWAQQHSLPVREDPRRGFFVEGAREFEVRSLEESVELLNWGLGNRVMGATRMNVTSSRSHTLLMVRVRRTPTRSAGAEAALRATLMLVDLAGSERVARTASAGSRLEEAKSINTSLSALGNVIAALADRRPTHVPYRDSKLTRLLQDNLGGQANTYLVATVGPCRADHSETLSTLTFASRCMRVAAAPVRHEEVDYAELAARLQLRLSTLERGFLEREAELQQSYESRIRSLTSQLQDLSSSAQKSSGDRRLLRASDPSKSLEHPDDALAMEDSSLAKEDEGGAVASSAHTPQHMRAAVAALEETYRAACRAHAESRWQLRRARERARQASERSSHDAVFAASVAADATREASAMAAADPFPTPSKFGPHLPRVRPEDVVRSSAEVAGLGSIDGEEVDPEFKWGREEDPTTASASASTSSSPPPYTGAGASSSAEDDASASHVPSGPSAYRYPAFRTFRTPAEVARAVTELSKEAAAAMRAVARLLRARDAATAALTTALTRAETLKRQREEELTNQSYVLKYLVDTNASLRAARSADTPPPPVPKRKSAPDGAVSPPAAPLPPPAEQPPTATTSSSTALSPTSANATMQRASSSPTLGRVLRRDEATRRADQLAHKDAAGERETLGLGYHSSRSPPGIPQMPAYSRAPELYEAPPRTTPQSTVPSTFVSATKFSSPQRTSQTPKTNSAHPATTFAPGDDDVEDLEDDIDRIVAKRVYKGTLLYKVRWKDAPPEEDEWFARQDLIQDFPEAVRQYEASHT